MKVLLTATEKGGEGKTAISRMAAEYMARAGKRVLVIDLDPQCNMSQRLLHMDYDETSINGFMPPVHPEFDPDDVDPDFPEWNGRSGIADIFYARPAIPYPTGIDNLDILPGDGAQLRAVELVTEENVKQRVVQRLHQFLSLPDVQEAYDVVVVDTSPSKGPLTRAGMRAATHVLIPCQMEPNSTAGLSGMLKMTRNEIRMREDGHPIHLIGIVINRFRRGVGIHEALRETITTQAATAPHVLPMLLSMRTAYVETDSLAEQRQSVFDRSKNDPARREAETLCKHILEELGV